eukprot:2322341-Prymnesium_polylepis.1
MYATPAVVGAVSYTLLQLLIQKRTLHVPDWVLILVPFALTLMLRAAAWTYRRAGSEQASAQRACVRACSESVDSERARSERARSERAPSGAAAARW